MAFLDMPYVVNQGWQCPKCGAVWSPSTVCCFNCAAPKSRLSDNTSETPEDWRGNTPPSEKGGAA